jgi:2-succinyl-5-enolpyruvyl-6-hydroxy-3-cyclohexene-1-carboxylate synthase
MPITFSNPNSIWASVWVESLHRLGLTTAVICPGSRSAPLAVAFAQHEQIEAIPVLDERSAAFFAIGLAKQSGRATALVCSSGTAGANFYPAVIEARESRVPLFVITADRPPELRDCNAGQTIDQQKLYGSFPNWYSELALPSLDLGMLAYLRQTIVHAWERTHYPVAGPVHLNQPFRDPLAPLPQPDAQALASQFPIDFFDFVQASDAGNQATVDTWLPSNVRPVPPPLLSRLQAAVQSERGIIIAGVAQPRSPRGYCEAIARLSKTLRCPVLAEGLSPLRNYADLNPYLISTYDLLLRQTELAETLAPAWVIRLGDMPTSKELRQWLERTQPQQWLVDPADRNLDPLHGKTVHLRRSVEQVAADLADASDYASLMTSPPDISSYLAQWLTAEHQVRRSLDQLLDQTDSRFEGKAAWLLSQHLPIGTPLFIANSTPVRDVEWFWQPGNRRIQPFFSRGANGIDGTLSTAVGMAHRQQSSVLLTGDLALLHDTNGFLLRSKVAGHLTIVLINNNGGGIFERLPIAQFDPPFEEFFATPQSIDFAQLCVTYGVAYELIESWEHLIQCLNLLPDRGIRLLELRSDRKADAQWLQKHLAQLLADLSFVTPSPVLHAQFGFPEP